MSIGDSKVHRLSNKKPSLNIFLDIWKILPHSNQIFIVCFSVNDLILFFSIFHSFNHSTMLIEHLLNNNPVQELWISWCIGRVYFLVEETWSQCADRNITDIYYYIFISDKYIVHVLAYPDKSFVSIVWSLNWKMKYI